jgi:hypothetical protein
MHIEKDHLNAYVYTYREMYRHDIYIYITAPFSGPTGRQSYPQNKLYSVPPEVLRVAVAGQQHSSG